MSVLPSSADLAPPLFDHLISKREYRRGGSDTESLGSFQIDDQNKLVRLLNRQIARLRTTQDFPDLTTRVTSLILPIG